MYMPDAIRATLLLMEAPREQLRQHDAYNLAGVSVTPAQVAERIRQHRAFQNKLPWFGAQPAEAQLLYIPAH